MVAIAPSPEVGYQEIRKWAFTQENELIHSERSHAECDRYHYYDYNAIRYKEHASYSYDYWIKPYFSDIQDSIICGYDFKNKGFTRTLPTKFENDPKRRSKLIRKSKKVIIDNLVDHYENHSASNYMSTSDMLGNRFATIMEELLVQEHYSNICKLNTHINKLFIQEVIPCFDDVEKLVDNIVLGVVENPILAMAEMRKKWFNHFSTIFDPYKKGGELRYVKGQELKLCNNLKQKD